MTVMLIIWYVILWLTSTVLYAGLLMLNDSLKGAGRVTSARLVSALIAGALASIIWPMSLPLAVALFLATNLIKVKVEN